MHRFLFCTLLFSFVSLHSQEYWNRLPKQEKEPLADFYKWDENQYRAIQESKAGKLATNRILELPNEKGQLEPFSLSPVSILLADLAKKNPTIKTYTGQSLERNGVNARVTLTRKGVSAWIYTPNGNHYFIQPEQDGVHYAYQRDATEASLYDFECKTLQPLRRTGKVFSKRSVQTRKATTPLQTFRIAITATGEYTQYWGDDDDSNGTNQEDAFAAVVATLNRINQVFETDLNVHLELVTGSELLQLDPATDPFTGNFNQEAQAFFTQEVGAENYDVGHLLGYSASADGNSGCLGCICVDNQKGQAYTLHPFVSNNGPYKNDYFDLDFVAHELGHQFGAYHTFSHINEGVGYSVEPGSGSTIMGYAGLVGEDNVQYHGDPYFHYVSIKSIREVVEESNCGSSQSVSNSAPEITPLLDYTIPKGTAYVLKVDAVDDEGDTLYYTWEQLDSGGIGSSDFGPQNHQGAQARSLPPSIQSKRFIPKWDRVLSGILTENNPTAGSDWETVSTVERTLKWGVTIRDRQANATEQGAQLAQDELTLTVTEQAGPFQVLSQATSTEWRSGNAKRILWDIANTQENPIGTDFVRIDLSIDGSDSFPYTLAERTSNDGEAVIMVPSGIVATQARIRVAAVDNLYFALNTAPITIVNQEHDLTLSSYDVSLCTPNSASIEYSLNYADGATQLSILNLPEGLSATFSNPLISTASGAGVLTIEALNPEMTGEYEIGIQAQSGDILSEFTFSIELISDQLSAPELRFPEDESTQASPDGLLVWEETPSTSLYRVQWSTDSDFSSAVNEKTTVASQVTSLDLDPETTYYWRVRAENNCGNSAYSPIQSFTTASIQCVAYAAEDLPLALEDATFTELGITTAEITISDPNVLSDLNVWVNIEHTYLQDLTLLLVAPDRTSIYLARENGGERNNYTNTLFDSEASQSILQGFAPYTGTFRPIEDLSKFKGKSLFGTWQLQIVDNAIDDSGRILAFELRACVEGQIESNRDGDSFVDRMDNCPEISNENQADYDQNGVGDLCDIESSNNFTVQKFDTSCIDKNNGRITIAATADFSYQVQLLGPNGLRLNRNFSTNGIEIRNLESGDYSLCITSSDDDDFEVCYTTSIEEPQPLSVNSKVLQSKQQLELNLRGASSYSIEINSKRYEIQNQNQVVLPLEEGVNELKVVSKGVCQEVYTERLYWAKKALLYPNPAVNEVTLLAGGDYPKAHIQIVPIKGEILYDKLHRIDPNTRAIQLNIAGYPPGLYLIRLLYAGGSESLKLIVE